MQLRTGSAEEVGMSPSRMALLRRAASWVGGKVHSALLVMAARGDCATRGILVS